ncbi:Gfo/Idh/MocA family oxidoreductase [soil metagenome]
MKTLRVGFVGAGGIVRQRHFPGLRAIEHVEIAAVANSTLASAEAFCRELAPEAAPMARWEDLVERDDIDAIFIGATPNLHRTVTLAALDAGKHVFCQARMAMNLSDAEDMLAASRTCPELVTMLCPAPHGLVANAFIKKLLADKALGDLRTIHLRSLTNAYLDPAKPAHWRQRREINGLNILTLGIHAEVLQRWFGPFTVVGALGKIFVPVRDGYTLQSPDAVQVLAHFDDGPLAELEFSGVYAGEPTDSLEIAGSKGVLTFDFLKDEIWLHHDKHRELLAVPPELSRPWQVEADFISAVRDPSAPRPHPNFADGVQYMGVVQRVNDLLSN